MYRPYRSDHSDIDTCTV